MKMCEAPSKENMKKEEEGKHQPKLAKKRIILFFVKNWILFVFFFFGHFDATKMCDCVMTKLVKKNIEFLCEEKATRSS